MKNVIVYSGISLDDQGSGRVERMALHPEAPIEDTQTVFDNRNAWRSSHRIAYRLIDDDIWRRSCVGAYDDGEHCGGDRLNVDGHDEGSFSAAIAWLLAGEK